MSYPPDPNNPYAKQPEQPQQPQQPGYGYPQQPPAQPQYGYPQQGVPPQGAPQQDPYAQQQPGYGYPQQPQQQGMPPQAGYGGYQTDPYANAGYGQAAYASWGSRVGAYLIDGLIIGLIPFILYIIAAVALVSSLKTSYDSNGYATGTTGGGGSGIAVVVDLLALLIFLAGALYVSYKEGTTGQSPGKKILNIRVVREADGQVLGFGMAFVRKIAYALNSIACSIGWLWPLWDDKSQTFADKVCSTVVLKA